MANIYKNAKLDLTTNTVVTLYTVPSDSRAIIKSILVSDDTNNGSSITVDLLMVHQHLLLNLICSRAKQ